MDTKLNRNKKIIQTSMIGILANVFLSIFKIIVGFASNSIAIIMDAVNNMSDVASSVVTIVGTKLASKLPDKKHPFGHGRIEYLSSMIISVLIIYAGFAAFTESVKKIIEPKTPVYHVISLIIVIVATLVKIFLGLYVKKVGKKVNSDSLVNSGEDALLDAVISTSTLIAALIYIFFSISLEAWLGAIIALIIIKTGVSMLKETISKILGESIDYELAQDIKKTIAEFDEVKGAYDLVIHNYGPDSYNGSVHIEVCDTLTAAELDRLIRKISNKIYEKYNIIMTAVGVYSINTKDKDAIKVQKDIEGIVGKVEYVKGMHGFYIDKEEAAIRFDVVISFSADDRVRVFEEVKEAVQKKYPDYNLELALDSDFSEQ